jgi:hypothetical protein
MGMYAAGIPVGIITDRKSPRLAALIGVVSLFAGYFPIHTGKLTAGGTSPKLTAGLQRMTTELAL